MSYFKFYYYLSVLIGVLQVIDGIVLASSSNIGAINLVFSLLEMLWVLFSVVAIFKVKVMKYVPVSYVVYNVAGWVYGGYLAATSENPETMSIPTWFAIFGLCFGLYFLTASILAIKHGGKNT